MKKTLFFIVLMIAVIVSCGGGGGGGDSSGEISDTGDSGDNSDNGSYELPASITASVFFDADQDGDLDLIVGGHENTLLLNDGSGNFSSAPTSLPEHYLGSEGSTVSLVAADFNQDKIEDILAITVDARSESFYKSSKLQLYLGNGDATFTDASSQIDSGEFEDWPEWTRVADFNADGALDFILAISGCSCGTDVDDPGDCYGGRIYLNDGNGNFSPTTVTTYDSANEYEYDKIAWAGGGDGTNTSLRVALDVLVGDMDNDGDVDIVAPNGYAEGPIVALLNESTTDELRFKIKYFIDTEQGGAYDQIQVRDGALLDINNDGYLDLVASMAISGSDSDENLVPVYAYINNGSGEFTADDSIFKSGQPGLEHARQWITDDFNNDGVTDLFIADHGYDSGAYPGHPNLLLLNDGTGALVDYSDDYLGTLSTYTHGASSGDANGDGYPDLFLNNNSDVGEGGAHLFLNDSGSGFTAADSRF